MHASPGTHVKDVHTHTQPSVGKWTEIAQLSAGGLQATTAMCTSAVQTSSFSKPEQQQRSASETHLHNLTPSARLCKDPHMHVAGRPFCCRVAQRVFASAASCKARCACRRLMKHARIAIEPCGGARQGCSRILCRAWLRGPMHQRAGSRACWRHMSGMPSACK